MKFSRSTHPHRQEPGADQPANSGLEPRVAADEIVFTLMWNGAPQEFVLTREILMQIDGSPDSEVQLLATFTRHQPRIIGVASRMLRAGVRGSPIPLRAGHFH